METWLFPKLDSSKRKQLAEQIRLLKTRCDIYKTHFDRIGIFDWQVFDAAKLEIFRIITLGIAGFDDPLSLKSLAESAAGLRSVANSCSPTIPRNRILSNYTQNLILRSLIWTPALISIPLTEPDSLLPMQIQSRLPSLRLEND